MLKELRYVLYLFVILLFYFLSLKYYFSDDNKKNSYRSLKTIDEKNLTFSQNLILLGDNTNDAVEYVKNTIDKNKKNYNFWKLIKNND